MNLGFLELEWALELYRVGEHEAAEKHNREAESLEEIWTTVYMRRLPAYTTLKQMATLEKAVICEYRERELYTFPVCLACCLK